MKITFNILLIFCGLSTMANSQQLPIYTQYFWNDFVINPAFTGMSKYSPIQVGVRNQWTGFKGAPATYMLGGHSVFKENKMGCGGMLFLDDKGGAIQQTGLMMNYSYFLKLNERSNLSFGLAGILNQYSYDGSNISTQSTNDLSLYSNINALAPDFNFGIVYVLDDRLKIGASANQLIQYRLKKWNEMNINIDANNKLVRHYNITASYLAKISDQIELEPYTFLRTTFINPIQFEFGARLIYVKNFFGGISYRFKDAFSFMIGTYINNFTCGYSYDITTSNLRNYSSGTHEVVLGYRFKKKIVKQSTKIH